MQIKRLLGLDDEETIFFAEESLADLVTLPVTAELLSSDPDFDSAFKLESDELLGIALHLSSPDSWLLLTDHFSEEKIVVGYASELHCEQILTSEDLFLESVLELYSLYLAEELFCDSCHVTDPPLYARDRIARLERFIGPVLSSDLEIMEVCCGSGMATQALYSQGFSPWTVDIDRCDVCSALKAGLLDPKRTLVLDARQLHHFFNPESFDVVLGFMVGLIDDFNWDTWRDILIRSAKLARRMIIFTVYTEKEANLIAKDLRDAGWNGEIIDNRDPKGIYDQWAYIAHKIQ